MQKRPASGPRCRAEPMPFPGPGVRRAMLVVVVISLAGCAVGPNLHKPDRTPPAAYNAHPSDLAHYRQRIRWTARQAQSWWMLFHSKTLDKYIRRAMHANPDLQAARAAVRRQQSLIAVAQGGLSPDITADATLSRSRALRAGANGGRSYRVPGDLYNLMLGTLNIRYNADVFGRQEDLVHAARARAAVGLANLRQNEVFLAAAVARAVISGAAAKAQLEAAVRVTAADGRLLDLLKQEYRLGYQNLQSVEQQSSITASASSRIAPLRTQLAEARHALATLLGRAPDSVLKMPIMRSLRLPAVLPTTVPSALAKQRPDIQAAAAELRVAAAQADVATADLYPRFDITAEIGKAATSGALFFDPASTLWGIGMGLAAPLYEGGALHARRRAAIDEYEVVRDRYRATLLNAFREVADALRALQGADAAYVQQYRAREAAGKALHLAEARYRDGVADYATVLNAEIAYQQDTVAAINGRSLRYLDSTALFLALGAGWRSGHRRSSLAVRPVRASTRGAPEGAA